MKSNLKKWIWVVFVFGIGTSPGWCSEYTQIKILTNEWPPYASAQLEHYGLFTEIVSGVFKELGITPQYNFMPWKRCENALLQGAAWAAFPYPKIDSRQQKFWFSDEILKSDSKLFYYVPNGNDYQISDLNDLKRYRLLGVLGTYYAGYFDTAGFDINYVYDERTAFEKLMLVRNGGGRVYDLFPIDETVGRYLIEAYFKSEHNQFKCLEKPFLIPTQKSNALYLMISRQFPHAVDLRLRFNNALQLYKKNKKFMEIEKKLRAGLKQYPSSEKRPTRSK